MVSSKETIYKSIAFPRVPLEKNRFASVFMTLLKQDDLSIADGLVSCPGILQQFCNKAADIRVSIFGDEVFAVRIDSQQLEQARTDFRAGALQVPHVSHELPAKVKDQCRLLVRGLDLEFGAIDLALMADGSYIFFEINPNGQWGWLEEITGLAMRRALLNLLFAEIHRTEPIVPNCTPIADPTLS